MPIFSTQGGLAKRNPPNYSPKFPSISSAAQSVGYRPLAASIEYAYVPVETATSEVSSMIVRHKRLPSQFQIFGGFPLLTHPTGLLPTSERVVRHFYFCATLQGQEEKKHTQDTICNTSQLPPKPLAKERTQMRPNKKQLLNKLGLLTL